MGLFKTPGFEEGLQAIHVFDYIDFTSAGNQLMLERHPAASDAVQPPIPDKHERAFNAGRRVP
ncbi:MAG: hypothetical protein ACLFV1_07805 [Thiohalophilus sp.]